MLVFSLLQASRATIRMLTTAPGVDAVASGLVPVLLNAYLAEFRTEFRLDADPGGGDADATKLRLRPGTARRVAPLPKKGSGSRTGSPRRHPPRPVSGAPRAPSGILRPPSGVFGVPGRDARPGSALRPLTALKRKPSGAQVRRFSAVAAPVGPPETWSPAARLFVSSQWMDVASIDPCAEAMSRAAADEATVVDDDEMTARAQQALAYTAALRVEHRVISWNLDIADRVRRALQPIQQGKRTRVPPCTLPPPRPPCSTRAAAAQPAPSQLAHPASACARSTPAVLVVPCSLLFGFMFCFSGSTGSLGRSRVPRAAVTGLSRDAMDDLCRLFAAVCREHLECVSAELAEMKASAFGATVRMPSREQRRAAHVRRVMHRTFLRDSTSCVLSCAKQAAMAAQAECKEAEQSAGVPLSARTASSTVDTVLGAMGTGATSPLASGVPLTCDGVIRSLVQFAAPSADGLAVLTDVLSAMVLPILRIRERVSSQVIRQVRAKFRRGGLRPLLAACLRLAI